MLFYKEEGYLSYVSLMSIAMSFARSPSSLSNLLATYNLNRILQSEVGNPFNWEFPPPESAVNACFPHSEQLHSSGHVLLLYESLRCKH